MENIAVETTQNVNIEYPIAGIPERIAAALLDFLIMLGYILLITVIYTAATSVASYENDERRSPITVAILIVFYLPVFLYSLLFETLLNGQSIGKRAVRIKVMRLDGRQASFGNYLMRWVLRLIDIQTFWGLVAVITIAINGKGQRLGDIAAGTMVIKLKHKAEISKTVFVKVQEDYVPKYPEVTMLTDSDMNIIKRVLLLRQNENREEAQEKLVNKLTQHLSINPESIGIDQRDFLKTLLKDYNKMNGRA